MKKILMVIMILLVANFAHAGIIGDSTLKNAKPIKDTMIQNHTYTLYAGTRGGRFYLKTSAKTGLLYKRYIK